MRIAVLSDTHGKPEPTRAALEMIRPHSVEAILHCGDIGSAELVELFADWPAHFVFGNVDEDRGVFRKAIAEQGQHCHDTFADLTLARIRIAMLHGDDRPRLRETIDSQKWDLVCYGHTHKPETRRDGSTLVLNPGALYRARPRTFAIVQLPSLDVEFLELPA